MDDRALVKKIAEIIGSETVADDCAAIPCGAGGTLVVSTDMLHRTTDFPEGMTDEEIGWMSVAVTISDLAGSGAQPEAVVLAVGLSDPACLEGIIRGADSCCKTYGARLVGGDLDHHDELTIVSTGFGFAVTGTPVRRNGAQTGDLIAIVGRPGEAMAGLAGCSQHRNALVTPQPKVEESARLAQVGVSCMMDVSDGLALSLADLAELNDVCMAVRSEQIPLPAGIPNQQAREFAIFGGGDFGLLFTCPPEVLPVDGVDAIVIGEVQEGEGVTLDGAVLKREGYQHTW
jgi:thiamine-monophosphate kinase